MEKTFTPDPLFDGLNNENTDELKELLSLIEQNDSEISEIFNCLDKLKCDVSDETVAKILEFAKEYSTKAKQKESIVIK
ncbi:MAG: hypothetical protein HC906_19980 [Bacteroidales bacterium]|nr:hypothetical protein [Bacteroidales bacterium]